MALVVWINVGVQVICKFQVKFLDIWTKGSNFEKIELESRPWNYLF